MCVPACTPRSPRGFIRESVSAIAALHREVDGVAHSALTPDRVILAPDGRLVIVEHVLGSALDRLDSRSGDAGPRARVPATETVARSSTSRPMSFSSRGSRCRCCWAAGLLPVSIPRRIGPMLDDFADASHGSSPALISAMRHWLERGALRGGRGILIGERRTGWTRRPANHTAGATLSHLPPARHPSSSSRSSARNSFRRRIRSVRNRNRLRSRFAHPRTFGIHVEDTQPAEAVETGHRGRRG